MKRPRKMSMEEERIIRYWLDKAHSVGVLRRVLCLWLRIKGHSPEQIAEMIGWSVGQVQKIQSGFNRTGEIVFMNPPKGGRRNQHMPADKEKAFINSLQDAKTGIIFLKTSEIKSRFELASDVPENTVSKSTIYRFLDRHGYKSVPFKDGNRVFQK